MRKQEFLKEITVGGRQYSCYDIKMLEQKGFPIGRLPFSIRVLVENVLRNLNDQSVKEKDLVNIASWRKDGTGPVEIPFHPSRVLMQDFTGVPAVVDLAAMRDAVRHSGGNPAVINPLIPVALVVDHSVQIDYYGTGASLRRNVAKEYERNSERYAFLKWAQKNFENFAVVPPSAGICHQLNLEYFSRVVIAERQGGNTLLYPDTLVGTDSHTTMINSIGVVGWGVGGIEAEAVMLGQPYFMTLPDVIGVKLVNELKPGVTATDLVLTITQILRHYNVVEKFVEFCGDGARRLAVTDRSTVSNMSPEYGATIGFFPVDEKTIEYLEKTNRSAQARIAEAYAKEQGLFCTGGDRPEYTDMVEIDLSLIRPCLAGPARPQDRIVLSELKKEFRSFLLGKHHRDVSVEEMSRFFDESGCVTCREEVCIPCVGKKKATFMQDGQEMTLCDGSIVIAAITSCTNTSNPAVLIGAGLLARNAAAKGLRVPPYVKTSLAPGSRVVSRYLEKAGLLSCFEKLGFYIAGFGCTTCIGNSGPLSPSVEKAIAEEKLSVVSILSGNRNFEARIHQSVKGNFLASPMLVVAFALCGRIDIDLESQPIGHDSAGRPVFLKDIWPDDGEIESFVQGNVQSDLYREGYARVFDGDELWKDLHIAESTTFNWNEESGYIKNPPYFSKCSMDPGKRGDIKNARALLLLGDSITTDHISPAGSIPEEYPSGRYLLEKAISVEDFNSYGSRRGNHEVMIRGTFGNVRIKNYILASKEGSFTLKFPEKKEMYVYEAAMEYQKEQTPLLVLAGTEYGIGSSRDWAAKGTSLLGIKAVIAGSYERIHRSNLVGMGVLPLQFMDGQSWQSLGLDGSEIYSISGITDMEPYKTLRVKAVKNNGEVIHFEVRSRLYTDIEVQYFDHGGILPYVLRKLSRPG